MLDNDIKTIKKIVEKAFPGKKAVSVVQYKGDFLVRVKHEDPDEEDFDPFVKVDVVARTVEDYSIIHDADDPAAVMAAFQNAK